MSSYFVNSLAAYSQGGTANETVRDYSQPANTTATAVAAAATAYRGYNHTLSAPAIYPQFPVTPAALDATSLADNARDFYDMNVAARSLSYTDDSSPKRDVIAAATATTSAAIASSSSSTFDTPVTSSEPIAARLSPQNLSQSGVEASESARRDSPITAAGSPASGTSSKSGEDGDSAPGADDAKAADGAANGPQIYPWMRRMHIGHGMYITVTLQRTLASNYISKLRVSIR